MRSERTATIIDLNCKEKGYGALGIGGTSNLQAIGSEQVKVQARVLLGLAMKSQVRTARVSNAAE